ncbi:uncharacterized protein DUF4157 [Streptomyces sp. 3212.3]|nr:uncharacterized protein DUF4157 [Streptomyces sp. 3212.3]
MRAQEERPGQAADGQRRPAGPVVRAALSAGWTTETIPALQRTAGNAAVQHTLAQERHEHAAGCGHPEPVPAQRSIVADVLRSAGRPLAADVRADMEQRLGADFSEVHVHTDSVAQRSAAEIGFRAYTSGSHVVVGRGGADKHTLAHELTHVVQQRSGPVAGTDNGAGLRVSDPSDRFEREAEANARRVMSGPAPRDGLTGVDATSAPGRRDSVSELPMRRVFQGSLSTYSTGQALAALKAQIEGSKPKWSEVVRFGSDRPFGRQLERGCRYRLRCSPWRSGWAPSAALCRAGSMNADCGDVRSGTGFDIGDLQRGAEGTGTARCRRAPSLTLQADGTA